MLNKAPDSSPAVAMILIKRLANGKLRVSAPMKTQFMKDVSYKMLDEARQLIKDFKEEPMIQVVSGGILNSLKGGKG